jgi:hypothetical protein
MRINSNPVFFLLANATTRAVRSIKDSRAIFFHPIARLEAIDNFHSASALVPMAIARSARAIASARRRKLPNS